MKIKHISIKNFRGIKELDWRIKSDLICFIGAGDSTKSTILDAIEYALFPKWNMNFEDSDFYNLDVNQDIQIDITMGKLPEELLSEQKYGLCLRGWNEEHGLRDEPDKQDEMVLTVSLQVAKDLEPKWLIKNDRLREEKRISASDRAVFGVTRLGAYVNRHLTWATGSILSSMTGEDVKINDILAEVARKIRSDVDLNSLEDVAKTVIEAEQLGKNIGVLPKDSLKAHIDIGRLTIKESGVSLHDGNIPLRLSGMGTQRLMGLALQLHLVKQGGINLIDEIEYGLEPHRICQILKSLRQSIDENGQIFLTTHSPCVLQELDISSLKIVFSEKGVTTIREFEDDINNSFQKLVRANPFAFLAKRVIVCEGKTEEGILRGIDNAWQNSKKRGMWSYGVVSVNGGGDNSFNVARQFKSLKYQVLWWGDSDVESAHTKKEELKEQEILIVEWDGRSNLEQRLFLDLPWEGVKELTNIVIDLHGKQSIKDQVATIYSESLGNICDWDDSVGLRTALGEIAHKKDWFKCISYGEKAGNVIAKYLSDVTNSNLSKKINIIRRWIEVDG